MTVHDDPVTLEQMKGVLRPRVQKLSVTKQARDTFILVGDVHVHDAANLMTMNDKITLKNYFIILF